MPHTATALGAEEYTGLVTSTLQKIEADLADQVLRRHPTLDLFRENSQSETGRALVYNLIAAEDDSTGFTDNSGSFSTDKSPNIIGAAEYEWSSPLVSKIRVDWKTLQMNSGEQQIVDLLKTHIEGMKRGHSKKLAQLIHNLGTAHEAGQFESFDTLFGDSSTNPTVGGITAGDSDHFWNAQRLTIASGTESSIHKVFRTVENELRQETSDGHQLTHIIAGRDVFEEYVDEVADKTRYLLNQGPADSNQPQTAFSEVYFGNIPVRFDPDCQNDRAYFIDINTLRLRYLNGNFMKVQPAQQITGTLDFVTPLATVAAVGTNERRANAVLVR